MFNDNDSSFLLQYEMQVTSMRQVAAEYEEKRAVELLRPSLLLRPKIFQDGNAWCALLGEDIAIGVVGWGDTPEAAFRDFDRAWIEPAKVPT